MLESSTSASNGSTNDWYDEETDSLAITIYKSTITFGNIILDDKMDFGSSANQNITSLAGRGGSGYQVRFYFSLGFNRSAITVGDVGISLADKLYLVDKNEIKGTRFIVSSMTSHDWLY